MAAFGGVTVGIVVMAATAWACVSGASVSLSTATAKAGQEVGVKGLSFAKADPVSIRLGSLSAPALVTLTPSASAPFGNAINGTFTVPEGTKPGDYVVIATQTSPDGKVSNAPVRVLLSVVGDGGSAPVLGATRGVNAAERQAELTVTDTSVGFGALALAALGVAGIGMFLAGTAALVTGRQRDAGTTPEVARP